MARQIALVFDLDKCIGCQTCSVACKVLWNQEENWRGAENVEPGMVKWPHLAGGYGHLQYRGMHWQPIPIDRAVHVDVSKA